MVYGRYSYPDLSLTYEKRISDKNAPKLLQVLEQGPVSIIIIKTDGIIEYVNARFCVMTGYSFDEIVGQKPRILQTSYTSKADHAEI